MSVRDTYGRTSGDGGNNNLYPNVGQAPTGESGGPPYPQHPSSYPQHPSSYPQHPSSYPYPAPPAYQSAPTPHPNPYAGPHGYQAPTPYGAPPPHFSSHGGGPPPGAPHSAPPTDSTHQPYSSFQYSAPPPVQHHGYPPSSQPPTSTYPPPSHPTYGGGAPPPSPSPSPSSQSVPGSTAMEKAGDFSTSTASNDSFEACITFITCTGFRRSGALLEAYPTVEATIASQKYESYVRKTSTALIQDWFVSDIREGAELDIKLLDKHKKTVVATGKYIFSRVDLYSDPFEVQLALELVDHTYTGEGKLLLHIFAWRTVFLPNMPKGEPVPFVMHKSTLFGVLSNTSNQETQAPEWPCYELRLVKMAPGLANTSQGWNKKYDAAIKIYGSTGGPIRVGVRSQHAALYRTRVSDVKGEITSGDHLLRMLRFGVRAGRSRYYTYVITRENKMRFSETGAPTARDFLSKHAVHANCEEAVLYSGEFLIMKNTETGRWNFLIDNNSGTFAPDKNLLPALKEHMELNFPGLLVQALHFDDSQQKVYKERVEEAGKTRTVMWNRMKRGLKSK